MKRGLFLFGLLLAALPAALHAETRVVERHYQGRTDTEIKVGVFTSIHGNCTPAPLPVVRLAVAPVHGRVSVRQVRLRATNVRNCLGLELPAFLAVYRSAPGFVGEDSLTIEVIGSKGRSELQRIKVTVTGRDAGRGI
ncbi:MAG: hypothetical protein IRY89_14070 [Pseudolabrys sp.]|nr:hypothetical protein [Pseudolabrys sp.]